MCIVIGRKPLSSQSRLYPWHIYIFFNVRFASLSAGIPLSSQSRLYPWHLYTFLSLGLYRYRPEHRSPLGDELLPHLSRHLGFGHHPARYRIQHCKLLSIHVFPKKRSSRASLPLSTKYLQSKLYYSAWNYDILLRSAVIDAAVQRAA